MPTSHNNDHHGVSTEAFSSAINILVLINSCHSGLNTGSTRGKWSSPWKSLTIGYVIAPQLVVRVHYPPTPPPLHLYFWDFVWLELIQISYMLSQLLWDHMCSYPEVSGKQCFLDAIWLSLSLIIFPPTLLRGSESWRKQVWEVCSF